MAASKYVLQPLLEVRGEQADRAKRELGERVRERERQQQALSAAEAETVAHQRASAALRDQEREALERGELRAVDLMRQQAWGMRVADEASELERQELAVQRTLHEATAHEATARQHTADKLGELKVVERDKQRFEQERRKAQLAKEEEAAEEAWRPRN